MRIALSWEDGSSRASALQSIRTLAEREIKRRLEAMEGVASVRVRGGLEREILVEVREGWMAARGVTIDQVSATLAEENVNLPGGAIIEGDHEYLVRTVGELLSVDDIKRIQIKRADGVQVPLTQVATVTAGHKDREVVSRLDGAEAVELEVFKSAEANIVQLSRQIRQVLGVDAKLTTHPNGAGHPGAPRGPPNIMERLPEGISLVVLEDQALFIEASLSNLRSTAVMGAFLAVAILFLFLRDVRATLIIATAIPLSIVATFAPMYLGGVSLNLMSLGGLALGIGMLVDNAIVVLENIHVQRERGSDRIASAIDGTKGVAAAVVASTLTTVCVFLPIAFVEGVAGQLFGDLSLAVVFSLLASLAVALFFVPMLAAHEMSWPTHRPDFQSISRSATFESKAQLKQAWSTQPGWTRPYWLFRFAIRGICELFAVIFIGAATLMARPTFFLLGKAGPWVYSGADMAAERFQGRFAKLEERYNHVIDWGLSRPGKVLGWAAMIVLISLPLFGTLGQSLIPEMHQGRFTAELALPVGTPLSRTEDVVHAIEKRLQDHPEIVHIHTVVGTEHRADSRSDEGEHTARLMIEIQGGGRIEARELDVMSAVRQAVAEQAENQPTVRMVRPGLFSFRTPIEVILFDRDLDRLRLSADKVVERLARVDGLTDVRSSLSEGYPEVRIEYDRTLLARFNLTTAAVAGQVRDKILGKAATSLTRGDGRVDLTVRLDPAQRRGVDMLKRLNINPELVPPIPLISVASFSEAIGPSEIRRVDQRRAVVVSANMKGFDLSGMATRIDAEVDQLQLESQAEIGGQNREM
jgi:HAE1 family hydrophobic/amphiphilic exporter-1